MFPIKEVFYGEITFQKSLFEVEPFETLILFQKTYIEYFPRVSRYIKKLSINHLSTVSSFSQRLLNVFFFLGNPFKRHSPYKVLYIVVFP